MAIPPFPQSRESQLNAWAESFAASISATPLVFSLTAAQATAFAALQNSFATSLATATNPLTNSKANIEYKKTAKDAMLNGAGGARQLVNIIQYAPNTTDDMRAQLNLRIFDGSPTPVPVPTEQPNIEVVKILPFGAQIRLHGNQVTGKPAYVKGASVFTHVGPTQPTSMEQWTFQENITKNTMDVAVPTTTPPGSTMWITAFWFNNRMDSSPPTQPAISVNIAGVQGIAA